MAAAVNLQRDAGLMMSNLQILAQFRNAVASDVVGNVEYWC